MLLFSFFNDVVSTISSTLSFLSVLSNSIMFSMSVLSFPPYVSILQILLLQFLLQLPSDSVLANCTVTLDPMVIQFYARMIGAFDRWLDVPRL